MQDPTMKEAKENARNAIVTAIELMDDYYNVLEADEDFGPVFDGSTFDVELNLVADRLSEASFIFNKTHNENHFGLKAVG